MRRTPPAAPVLSVILAVVLLLSGCGKAPPEPTPAPTATPAPTDTPAPTATFTPVPTPTPTPLPLAAWVAEGDAALAASDFVAAEAAYRRAIDADESYAPAHTGLAWAYAWQLGRSREALDAAEQAARLAPEDPLAWAAVAHTRYLRDLSADAVEAGEKAVGLDPGSAVAQAALARAYAMDLRHAEALAAAVEAVTLDPRSAYAYSSLAVAHEAHADFGRAQAAIEEAIALQGEFAHWHIHLGDLHAARLRYDAAQEAYEKALALAPDHPRALLGLARLHASRNEFDEAGALIAQAAGAAPGAIRPLVDWGYLHLRQDEYDEAAAKFTAAARLEPDAWQPREGQAEVRVYQGDCESAAGAYQDLVATYPRVASLRVNNAWAKWCLGDSTRALELARAAVQLDPYNTDAHWLMGMLLAEQERWEESAAAYLSAARYAGAAAPAHAALGESYLYQDDLGKAEAQYALAARLDPHRADGPSGLCTAAWWENRPDKMLAPCEQAALLDPLDEGEQAMWGVALFLNGRAAEAVPVLMANLDENPDDLLSHLYLGLSHLRQKQYPEARKALETYKKLSQTTDFRTSYMIDSAGQGWELREAKALEFLQDESSGFTDRDVTWKLEGAGEITRTLTVSLAALEDEEPEALYTEANNLLVLAAFLGPRITPEVNGGAAARVSDAAGKPLFERVVSAADLWLFLGGDLSNDEFTGRMAFVQPEGGPASADVSAELVREVGEEVVELRELPLKQPVASQLLDQTGLEAHLEAAEDGESQEEALADDLLLTLLGALAPEADLWEDEQALQAEGILGFYDTDDQTFYIVTDKAPGLTDRTTVAHEYLHALQDQHFGIGAGLEAIDNDDQGLAYLALVEGDAQVLTALYMEQKLPLLDLLQTFEAAAAEVDEQELERSPAVLRGWMEFPYARGMAFVSEVYRTGGWEAVNDLFADPPVSTEQVLHPERYRAREKPVEVTLPDLAQTLGGDWRIARENTLGELTWQLILTELAGPAAAANAAEGWGGDRFVLLQQGAGGPGAALVGAAWDRPADAEEFWSVLRLALRSRAGFDEVVVDLVGDGLTRHFRGPGAYWIVRLDGKAVTLAIGPDEEIAAKLFAAAE